MKRFTSTILTVLILLPTVSFSKVTTKLNDYEIVHAFLTSYTNGKTADMDKLASGDGLYSRVTAHHLPRKLLNFIIFDSESGSPEDISKKSINKAKKNGWKYFQIGANDSNGETCYLVAYTKRQKVVCLENDPAKNGDVFTAGLKQPVVKAKGILLSREDRLQIIHTAGVSADNGYVDFSYAVDYKGYTRADPGFDEIQGLGAATYWHKVKGKWKVILETQDVVTRADLRKLGVPRDVQDEVFADALK